MYDVPEYLHISILQLLKKSQNLKTHSKTYNNLYKKILL